MRLMDKAYERVVAVVDGITDICMAMGEIVVEMMSAIISLLFTAVACGTFLSWVIPYKIAKRNRRGKGGVDDGN